ncbi:hypothetical protein BT96DRAFT_820362 [Gymnopus androsaceus JB14]|uniref:Methyltransferase domain-containing protein n=1 Tax=Gymnopus androsaceus JB14 TaxID=1447944 RepID=A0A6A4HRK3_9AGAR|nr:hypothetical protein BT96DRAFT_820362 [Gymnopus androsaceus JB14]
MTQPNNTWFLPLDEKYYNLDEEEKHFFKKETGIQDDDELKKHIITVQNKAFSICPYPCIRIFEFARLKLGRLPAYEQLLKLGREREGAILIDLGCCFGNDIRKAIQDGYPVQSTLATDLHRGLWDLGHEMFKSTPQSLPTPFIEGDIMSPDFLSPVPPFTKDAPPTRTIPSLDTITSLNDLRGHVSAVYTGAFFHLFSEMQQEQIAHALASLLSPEPGSMLLGVHGGKSTKGMWSPTGYEYKMFCHSPDSWKELWERIFGKANVEIKAQLRREIGGDIFFDMYPGNKDPYHVMEWSVTRL